MTIIELDRKRLPEIKGLWKELNALHGRLSQNFKEHFDSFTFKDRVKQLAMKTNLSLFVANEEDKYIGYCIVTSDKGRGEIDSIYIQPKYQGKGIGNQLMLKAMDWLNNQNCKEINIHVAEGNESVLGFYEKMDSKSGLLCYKREMHNNVIIRGRFLLRSPIQQFLPPPKNKGGQRGVKER